VAVSKAAVAFKEAGKTENEMLKMKGKYMKDSGKDPYG